MDENDLYRIAASAGMRPPATVDEIVARLDERAADLRQLAEEIWAEAWTPHQIVVAVRKLKAEAEESDRQETAWAQHYNSVCEALGLPRNSAPSAVCAKARVALAALREIKG